MHVFLKRISFVLLLVFIGTSALQAQDNAAMTGSVTDPSGAVVSDTTVTLTNPSRGLRFMVITTKDGTYRFPNVPPAPGYKVEFNHPGFASVTITDVTLAVGSTRTQDAKLSPGTSATVEVTAANNLATLNTTDASIGNNFDVHLIDDLPVQNRDSVAALFYLQPGVSSQGAVTGARTDQTSVTVDGMDVNDISTGQFGNVNGGIPVDATQEFKATVAGLPANLGTGSGAQFQLVTKSGTNSWHGDLNEYHRDTVTTSNLWFNANSGVPRTALIRNQFGGAIGGPVLKDKLFFFFDFNNSRIISALSGSDTVPLDSYRNGNVGYVKSGCAVATRQTSSTAATCIGYLTPAQVKALDPAGIGENATLFSLFNSRYPHANDLSGGDGVNTGFFRYTQPTANILYNGVGRLDYNLSSKQRVFVQYHIANQESVQSVNRFPGDPLTRPFQDRSYGYVGSHIWTIGNNKVNQLYYGDNVTVFSFPLAFNPLGATIIGSLSGIVTTPYDAGNIQRRRVPIPMVRDDFNWTHGEHTISLGGSFKFIKASNFLGSDFNTYTLGTGGNTTSLIPTLRPADIQATGTVNNAQFDNAFVLSLGRVGRISSIYNFDAAAVQQASGSGSTRRFRYYQTELYVGDTWKMNKQLTLSYGLRYSLYSVPFETLGAESIPNIGFDDYFAARLAQTKAGLSGPSSVPFLVYNLGGKVNNAPGYYASNLKDFAPRVAFAYNPDWLPKTVFNGSADIVYDRTVANAVNFLQNQNTFLFQNNTAINYGVSTDAAGSLKNDPRVGATLTALPAAPTVAAPVRPYTPYVSATGVPTGLANGNGTYVVDPHLKDPYNITMNLGVQQELPGHMILRLSYAGRLGRRLIGQADASQLIDFADPASGQALSAAFASLTTQLRAGVNPTSVSQQPFFTNQVTPGYGASHGFGNNSALVASAFKANTQLGDITDVLQALAANGLLPANVGMGSQFARATYVTNKGFSNYNGLLLTLTKNLSQGVKFDFNYTWSHSIDNVSLIANASAGSTANNGTGFICDVVRPSACRASSDFDTTHILSADFIVDLPFGRGKRFGGNSPWYLNEVIGGWQISGIPKWQSGFALTTATNAFLAGFANNVPAIYDGSYSDDTSIHLHKNAANQLVAFNDPAKALSHFRGPIGIEYGSRNVLRGPSQLYFDAGLAKTFQILPDNRLDLKFRADAFNVLNHPTFGLPNTTLTSSNFGVITTETNTFNNARRVGQFSLRLEF